MTISRFDNERTFKNINTDYLNSDFFKRRGLKGPIQYGTYKMRYPSPEETLEVQPTKKIWGTGDKYFKLAHQHYGSVEYWWVIAWWNQRPLETSFLPGDTVEIPKPLNKVLELYGL